MGGQKKSAELPVQLLPDEFCSAAGFREGRLRAGLFSCMCVASLGLAYFLALWYPRLRARLSLAPLPRDLPLRDADHVLLLRAGAEPDATVEWTLCPVQRVRGETLFEYRKQRYVWQQGEGAFRRVDASLCCSASEALALRGGATSEAAAAWTALHGPNEITVDTQTVLQMVLFKVSHPFYVFQVFSALVWFYQSYDSYAVIILAMSVGSIAWEIAAAKRNEANLRRLVRVQRHVRVLRDGRSALVPSRELVVGDVVELTAEDAASGPSPSASVVCDMVLLSGQVVVDESTLTGESIPIVKQALPPGDEPVRVTDRHKHHALFNGSSILQVQPAGGASAALALVASTGFCSAKGELFRSILYPHKMSFRFYRDAFRFLAILSCVAFAAFLKRCVDGLRAGSSLLDVVITSLDLVTIAVPPALPLVLTAGVGFSMDRLRRQRIACIDPQRISMAGRVDTMCWDKTGTLTTSNVSFFGVEPVARGRFSGYLSDVRGSGDLEVVLAACHGVSRIDGSLVGHSVDLAMFHATRWLLEGPGTLSLGRSATLVTAQAVVRPPDAGAAAYILRRFDFDNQLQRSCVLVAQRPSDGSPVNIRAFVKGSPEAVRSACKPKSIPADFDAVFRHFSSQGLYVLACACRKLDSDWDDAALQTVGRASVECDLEFAGFVLLHNPVKAETPHVLLQLRRAGIRNVIITGDNALTAVHVARETQLVRRVAMVDLDANGELVCHEVPMLNSGGKAAAEPPTHYTFDELPRLVDGARGGLQIAARGVALERVRELYQDEVVDWLLAHADIYARVKPQQKTWIVERLIRTGKVVGMCGDGTNDCGALKAAHVGVALSTAEASIVAPLTSQQRLVADVPRVLREGRCALTTSFAAFKFMTVYPVVQLMLAATLNHLGSTVSNNQYLFDDLALVLGLGMLMLLTAPARQLRRDRPTDSLFAPAILASLAGQTVLCVAFFAAATARLFAQPWFCSVPEALQGVCFPIDPVADMNNALLVKSHENTTLWLFTHWQYLLVAVAFSVGAGFRRPFYTNRPFLACICACAAALAVLQLWGPDVPLLAAVFQLVPGIPPAAFRWHLFALVALQGVLAIAVWELLVVRKVVGRWSEAQTRAKQRRERIACDEAVLGPVLLAPARAQALAGVAVVSPLDEKAEAADDELGSLVFPSPGAADDAAAPLLVNVQPPGRASNVSGRSSSDLHLLLREQTRVSWELDASSSSSPAQARPSADGTHTSEGEDHIEGLSNPAER